MVGVRVAAMSLRGVGLLHGGRLSGRCAWGFFFWPPAGAHRGFNVAKQVETTKCALCFSGHGCRIEPTRHRDGLHHR
jgi:hypothetical protein